MKTKSIQLFLVALFFCNFSFAKIFRIGNIGTAVTGVDYAYTNMSAAITAATAGDTIQLYQQYWGGATGTITVNKRLTFIGFGYFLDKNKGLQAANSPDNNLVTLYFTSGSEGTTVQGVFANFYINANNIKVNRCRINNYYLYNNIELSDLTISQCFINQLYESYTQPVKNIVIKNNFLSYVTLPNSTGIFSNNVITYNYYSYTVTLYSFLIKNNIFNSCITGGVNIIQNNLFSSTCAVGSGTNNKFNVSMADVFVNWNSGTIAADSQLVVKSGSAAINAGLKNDNSATDAGMFGGETGEAYRLSGIPAVPSIYKLSANSQTANTNPYVITLSVRSNN